MGGAQPVGWVERSDTHHIVASPCWRARMPGYRRNFIARGRLLLRTAVGRSARRMGGAQRYPSPRRVTRAGMTEYRRNFIIRGFFFERPQQDDGFRRSSNGCYALLSCTAPARRMGFCVRSDDK